MNAFGYRKVEACPQRRDVAISADSEVAKCSILEHFLGAFAPAACVVERDVCAACIDTFPPSTEDINHVLASLLYTSAETALLEGTLADAERSKIEALRDWAEKCLPLMFPDEDDASIDVSGPHRD